MTSIVGHKVERYLTAVQRDYGGHWDLTHHQIITELHATKGWREVSHERKLHVVKKLPPVGQWRAADVTMYVHKENRNVNKIPLERPPVSLKAQMRHRERRRDLQITANLASMEAEG